jgi:Galactose oxidase-like, Early set domain/Bacterial Ig domain
VPMLRLGSMLIASTVLAALNAPGAAAHDGVETAAGHAAEDAVIHSASLERGLDAQTRAAIAADAAAAAAAVAGAPQDVGQWGPVVDWPVIGVHVALLPNGKVLAYDSIGDNATESYPVQDHTRATVWDPSTGTQTPVNVNTGYNVFCSGLAHLVDGRLFLAGGNKDQQLNGIVQTHLFDPASNTWSLGPNMAAGRWYPSVTPLRNGEMLITSGRVNTPEVRTLSGALRTLSTAPLSLPLYPWMDVAPDGRAFYSGPDQTMRTLDTSGTGAWQSLGQRDGINRDYGSHALFDVGKMLVAGGGPSTPDARVIDVTGATPQVTATAPMAHGRRQHNLTVLADGSVLATGGNSSGASLVDLANGVYAAELWNPATGQWRTLAAMQITRQYHSTALLLPDGRVLSSGGGICGTCDQVGYLAKNAEIFSPPYLFQADGTPAPRPVIGSAPATSTYGAALDVATPNPAAIRTVALVRLGAVTHSVNMEQRYVPLSFIAGTTSLSATGPANANIAPPGPYMLFIIDANGVPSVARMISIQGNSPPVATLDQPANGASFTAPANISLAATASDADGTVSKVEFFNGTTKLGEDATAPYSIVWSGVGAGTYTLTARATDDLGYTSTSSPSTVTVLAANKPPTAAITSPADGTIFAWKPTITVTATASDPDGSVSKVEFLDGTTVLAQKTIAPYSYTWRNVPSGSHVLRVRATDNTGAATTSAPVGITVRPKR